LQLFLPYYVEKNIGVAIGGPFNSGILAMGPKRGARYDYRPAPPAILERVRRLETIRKAHGVKLAEVALRFPLSHPAIVSVIPVSQKSGEVRRNAEMLSARIPTATPRELKADGLLRPDAPTPR
jgi:D-threo-aldose 1-dehydrogenase